MGKPTGAAIRFFNGTDSRQGLEAGRFLGVGNAQNVAGMTFKAQVLNYKRDIFWFQNVTDLKNGSNGTVAGAVDTVAALNKNVKPIPNSGITLPGAVLDSPNAQIPILPASYPRGILGDTINIEAVDSPAFGPPPNQANSVNTFDIRKYLKSYLVVQYTDGSICTLATVTWNVNFYATKSAAAGANITWADTLDKASAVTVVSAGKDSRDVAVTVPPIANGSFSWQ